MRRYFIYAGIALLTFLVGAALYLILPGSRSRIGDIPREPPVALIADEQNKGRRCEADTLYVAENTDGIESAVINPYCAKLQEELVEAARDGDVERARALLASGANPNSVGMSNNEYYRPLSQAAYSRAELVKLLLDNGADVNREQCCCMSCRSPLTTAVAAGNVDTVRLLLARGADVRYRDRYDQDSKMTVLGIARVEGNREIVDLLEASVAR